MRLDTTRQQEHAGFAAGWLDRQIEHHWHEPPMVLLAVAVADLYGQRIALDPSWPVGQLPDRPADAADVEAHLGVMLTSGRVAVFPAVICWDRPWVLRPEPACEAPDVVTLLIGLALN